jgi:hypothetical protein
MARGPVSPLRFIALVMLLVTSAACTAGHGGADKHAASDAQRQETFEGSYGVEARWIVAENRRPGTTAWRISGDAGGTTQGFANTTQAKLGQRVTLYVTSRASSFRAVAYRMGYYRGAGAREIWRSPRVRARVQPRCPRSAGTNMVACDNWRPSVRFTVTSAFVPGDYLIKLTGADGQQSYVPLTIWDPGSTATYLVKNDVFTWQAWNPYGGYDFYSGRGRCPAGVYPLCSRARVVSYDRPYGYRQGAGDFLGNELPLVYFAEQHGLDVTYVTDLSVQQDPGILARHRVLLSLGHDECWSLGEREAAVHAHDAGVNIVFFAASAVLRHVRTQSSPLGAGRELVDYRDGAQDPLNGKGNPREVTGNTWAAPPANWPEDDFVGESYAGFLEPGRSTAFRVVDAVPWLFAGTGLHAGSTVPGVIASDVDRVDNTLGHPANVQILAHSPIAASLGQTSLGSFASDMSYYTGASGGGVLDTGTNNWIPALTRSTGWVPGPASCARPAPSCPAAVVQRITGNLLRAFGQGPMGRRHASVANWKTIDH